MTAKPHARLDSIEVEENEFIFGGRRLAELECIAGQTPFYAYDRGLISQRIQQLRDHLPPAIELHYAIKANPMPAVVNFVAPLVDGLDIASGGELPLALGAGTDPREISFAGPGKRPGEIRQAVASGVTVTLESMTEMQRAVAAGESSGVRPRVAVRVNPDFELRASGMKMSGGAKQFGIDAESVPDVLARIAECDLEFVGLHIFCGSQNLREDSIIDAQQQTVDLALRLIGSAPNEPEFINIGGGFGIPYFPGETPIDLVPIGQALAPLVENIKQALPNTSVVMELGRFIIGEAGIYVCKVLDRKVSRGQVFLVTDGGLHHHLAASGNFGQILRKNYPVFIGNRVRGDELEPQMIVGPLCTPLDLLGDAVELPPGQIDDYVVVMQSGAYGLTASPLGFLSHPHPVEILV